MAEDPDWYLFQARDDPNTFHYVVSEPLGRSTYKERYLFLFRCGLCPRRRPGS